MPSPPARVGMLGAKVHDELSHRVHHHSCVGQGDRLGDQGGGATGDGDADIEGRGQFRIVERGARSARGDNGRVPIQIEIQIQGGGQHTTADPKHNAPDSTHLQGPTTGVSHLLSHITRRII